MYPSYHKFNKRNKKVNRKIEKKCYGIVCVAVPCKPYVNKFVQISRADDMSTLRTFSFFTLRADDIRHYLLCAKRNTPAGESKIKQTEFI